MPFSVFPDADEDMIIHPPVQAALTVQATSSSRLDKLFAAKPSLPR